MREFAPKDCLLVIDWKLPSSFALNLGGFIIFLFSYYTEVNTGGDGDFGGEAVVLNSLFERIYLNSLGSPSLKLKLVGLGVAFKSGKLELYEILFATYLLTLKRGVNSRLSFLWTFTTFSSAVFLSSSARYLTSS